MPFTKIANSDLVALVAEDDDVLALSPTHGGSTRPNGVFRRDGIAGT